MFRVTSFSPVPGVFILKNTPPSGGGGGGGGIWFLDLWRKKICLNNALADNKKTRKKKEKKFLKNDEASALIYDI